MAEALLEGALEKLSSLAGRELGFQEDKVKLASLFTAIKAILADAEERQFFDMSIKDWLRMLKDAAYDLDDIVDEYAYEALGLEHQQVKCGLSDKVQSSCLSSFHPKNVFGSKIAKKMKRIIERLKMIVEEMYQFHFREMVPETETEWHQTTSLITEPQVYGREEDTYKIFRIFV